MGRENLIMAWILVAVLLTLVYVVLTLPKPPISTGRTNGVHCLNNQDGSHPGFIRHIQSLMMNLDSFEHLSTSISRSDQSGNNKMIMRYRSQNGSDGMSVEKAVGIVTQKDCSFVILPR